MATSEVIASARERSRAPAYIPRQKKNPRRIRASPRLLGLTPGEVQ